MSMMSTPPEFLDVAEVMDISGDDPPTHIESEYDSIGATELGSHCPRPIHVNLDG